MILEIILIIILLSFAVMSVLLYGFFMLTFLSLYKFKRKLKLNSKEAKQHDRRNKNRN